MLPLTQKLALGVGAAGALVDVTAYCTGPEGVTYGWGRQDEFRDPSPGTIQFTLENQDGRFTPDSASTPLATPLTEGTAVCWQLGTGASMRLVQMQVITIGFASSEDQWGRVVIQCADALNAANRDTLQDLGGTAAAVMPYLWWPMNDPAGSLFASEQSGNNGPTLGGLTDAPGQVLSGVAFGIASAGPTTDTACVISANRATPSSTGNIFGNLLLKLSLLYPSGSWGSWGFWWTPQPGVPITAIIRYGTGINVGGSIQLDMETAGVTGNCVSANAGSTTASTGQRAWRVQPHYLAFTTTYSGLTATTTFYCDGVSFGTCNWPIAGSSALLQPTSINFTLPIGQPSTATIGTLQHVSHTPYLIHEEAAGVTTEAARFALLTQTVPQITAIATDPQLSTAPVDIQSTSGSSAFSALADLLRTEQGHFYFATSGSLLSPSTVMNFRSRVRPATPSQTFDSALELQGVPQFVRDITNLYSTVTASGPNISATVVDKTLLPKVGSAYVSETAVFASILDQTGWASDRLLRGKNVNLKIASFTIDTLTLDPVQSAATVAKVLALLPGDRIRISNLPTGPLGFTSWDGWFLGCSETHTYMSDSFTLYVSPVLPNPGIFDTDLFADGGTVTLSSAVTSGSTTATVQSADGVTWFERTAVPYTVLLDQEQATVTAAGAPSGGIQTLTINRGVNGTTAAAHAVGATPEIVSTSNVFAF